jgi:hypothetical protein
LFSLATSTAIPPDYSRKGGQAKNATLHGLARSEHGVDVGKSVVFIVLFERTPFGLVTPTEVGIQPDFLSYTNLDTTEVMSVDLGIPSNQNFTSTTVSVTLYLNHYETPQWVYFGIGVVLSSLAVIPIFKSRK